MTREGDPADLVASLTRARATLATAESLSGGLLGTLITTVPGASTVYRGGVVAYATDVKVTVLGVPQGIVDEYGVVSAACAEAMASRVRVLAGATYGLSTTGVAGPDTQEGKPVGTVFVGLATPTEVTVAELALSGDREAIRQAACRHAIGLLTQRLGLLPHDTMPTDAGRARREETSLG